MKLNRIIKYSLVIFTISLNIGCDQVSKKIARNNLHGNEEISFLNDHFTLTKIENTGAFLSIGESLPKPLKQILLIGLPLLMVGGSLAYVLLSKELSQLTIVGICFFIGGGIGNLYDRAVYHSVTDFMHIDLGVFQTGIFNMADLSIMLGTGLALLGFYRDSNVLKETPDEKTGNQVG